jgi:rsbT co-antagonist protein RsbR
LRKAPFAVLEHDGDLVITGWNEGAARIFGHAREEAVGRSLVGLVLSDADVDAWRRLHEDEDGGMRVFGAVRKDGSAALCEWSHEPLLDERGQASRMLCFGQDVTARVRSVEELKRQDALLRAMLDHIELAVCAYDRDGNFTYHQGKVLQMVGLKPGEFVGKNVFDLYQGSRSIPAMRRALAGELVHAVGNSHGFFWDTWYIPTRDERGEPDGMISVTLNATERVTREEELRARLALIEQQRKVIRDLSTPIIEVWDRVLTLPMMGVVDSARTAEVMDNLLEAVVSKRARFAILDLTGVEAVDTQTASYLIELVRAIRLLGAEGVISGIRPSVAQTMVTLGLDLTGIATEGNLRAALKLCMRRTREDRG